MDHATAYVSAIPPQAFERVIKRHANWVKLRCEYLVEGAVIGTRDYDAEGGIEAEHGLQDGRRHGSAYSFHNAGKLLSLEPYQNGVLHGTAYQWAENGALLGTYTLEHGTGLDLWWQDWKDSGTFELAEAHFMQDGQAHGFEWWLNGDGLSVWSERHWRRGAKHGIERVWGKDGQLGRSFPRFWLDGRRVTRTRYERAAADDVFLPPFRIADNLPLRDFPLDVAPFVGTRPLPLSSIQSATA